MNHTPDFIIAKTVSRYLNPPDDKSFWRKYQQLNEKTPHNLMQLITSFITVNEMEQKLLQKGDSMLFEYILALNGNTSFPESDKILNFEKEHFTPDDNDFYNRVIYEKEIAELKNEVQLLKLKLKIAVNEKKHLFKKDYEFIQELGKGGFGTVSLVKHTISNQMFAIKRLTQIDANKQSTIKKEIETLASLGHPNVIGFRTAFNFENSLFLVMEYCPKGTLLERLNLKGRIHEEEIVNLFLTLTKAFDFLHGKNIIHHDIKPSNILFGEDNNVKISDFGCANSDVGTRVYLPPEADLIYGYKPSPKSDIFSLGVMLMECALGYHPFVGKTGEEKIEMIKSANLPISILPFWLQDTILKALHFDPFSRFDSMKEFHNALIKRNIPQFLNKKIIKLENDASRLSWMVQNRKWVKANRFINTHPEIDKNLNLIVNTGIFYLRTHDIKNAKYCFESALKLNPEANIEKQIAEVYLQLGETSKAFSILTGYVNRNFSDIEAHNQLLYAYYLSGKWELGLQQSLLLRDVFTTEKIIKNNLALFSVLLGDYLYLPDDTEETGEFCRYNIDVFQNNMPSCWCSDGNPSLFSKLLFQEFTFRKIENSVNELEITIGGEVFKSKEQIISFGRQGFNQNTFSQFKGTSISRRHFVIVNMKNNVWLYDLESTGVFVDGTRVNKKYFLLGFHKIKFGNYEIEIKTDTGLLI